jgi:hypothetical protein
VPENETRNHEVLHGVNNPVFPAAGQIVLDLGHVSFLVDPPSPLMRLPRLLALGCLVFSPLALHAQNTVFNDAFTGDALDPATYPAVTATTTGWQVASSKTPANPTTTGGLQINMVSTSSGFVEAQALFTATPVQLLPGTYIEFTGTFTAASVLVHASDTLGVGLFNSGGTAPIAGLLASGLSSSITTQAAGGAKGWLGYDGYIAFTAGTSKLSTRAAQTSTNNTNQDVIVGSQSSSAGYSTPAGVSIAQSTTAVAALTNGAVYTLDYKLSLSADGNTLAAVESIYNGTGTTGIGANTLVTAFTGNITGATLLTKTFDAMAIGWRADASVLGDIKFTSLTVNTTGGAPWFISQPPATASVSTGSNLTLTTVVGGTGNTYQWQKSTDGGATFSAISPAANPLATTVALTLTGALTTDAGTYELIATNAAGATTSAQSAVTVTASAVPPAITIQPVGGTSLVGTPFTFSVTANGTAPLGFQWYKSTDGGVTYNPVSGATSPSYLIPATALSDTGMYEVTVSNVAGNLTSTPVTLTVDQAPVIATQPVGTTLTPGSTYVLSVSASGTPTPTYQWYLNGAVIAGATLPSYTILSASGASAGNYTVVVSNSAGGNVPSSVASIVVLSPTLSATAETPTSGASTQNPDTRLTITFNQAIAVGVSGKINIYNAASPGTPVDTIDLLGGTTLMNTLRASSTISTLALPVQNKTIGGLSNFNYYPVTIAGNTATLYLRNGVLAYGQSYYVTIDPGAFTDASGLGFAGLAGSSAWTFATKASGPAVGSTVLTVAPDSSANFSTVQAALDFIPSGNTTPTTIYINPGTYFEEIYFTGKHAITFLGASRTGTVIVYPNNNTFNNTSGTYHRMTLQADHVNNVVFTDLTVQNSTAHGGSQAEALLLNGTLTSQAIITRVNLLSFQDTLQINGQAYISDSHISGDVDFMWGNGPNFFVNCELTALTSSGYYTQIRNPSTNHGNVYLNCTLDAASGVTGSYLGRIDPTPGTGFPFSEVVYLNCVMGTVSGGTYATNINPVGWLLNNTPDQTAASAPNVHFWEYNSQYTDGTPLSVTSRIGASQQLSVPATIANYSTPSYVLGNGLGATPWIPALAPILLIAPAPATVPQGQKAVFTTLAAGVPDPSYQWSLNSAVLADGVQSDGSIVSGSATATLTIQNVTAGEAGASVTVVASNLNGAAPSSAVTLTVIPPLASFTTEPAAQTAVAGSTATFTAAASGATGYQWYFNGAPISGNPSATTPSLSVASVSPLNMGTYTLVAINGSGSAASTGAILNVTAAAGSPVLPVIPGGVFNVTAYGAVADGLTDNTAAIQAAINAALSAGGGTVEIPAAPLNYMCGPITLGSAISLQVDTGATLQALPNGTYPDPSNNPANFITLKNATNVQLVGGGTIDGNGAAWWVAFANSASVVRPRLVQTTNCSDVLVAGVTLSNSPEMHLVYGTSSNVTIDGITISCPGTSPNTDGIDPAGSNFLIENSSISDGDDNIAVKPQNVFCTNIVVTNCSFGTGHGVGMGGQTNDGLNGLTITNCTFNGTTYGLRLKADATEGGPVQNVTFANITMTNVTYPITLYSYYNFIGTPGQSGTNQITPAKANSDNVTPPDSLASSTIPTWQNITISNVTATGASGFSIIWGLPLANGLFSNVTLNNVSISGGGLEIYDAAAVQFTGTVTVASLLTDNALVFTGQPSGQTVAAGQSAIFSAAVTGTSGITSTPPTYRWTLNGIPLADGGQADGSVVAGSATTTLSLSNLKVSDAGAYALVASNNLDGFNVTGGTLADNSLPVSVASSSANLTVTVAPATVSLSNLSQTFDGAGLAPTILTSPAGLGVAVTYNGSPTVPTAAGTYAVVVTVSDPSYTGAASGTLVINPASASIVLSGLSEMYTGNPAPIAATTSPSGIATAITYNGSTTVPTYPGSYAVSAALNNPNYTGGPASGTLTIGITALLQNPPVLVGSGAIEGSVQVLSGKSLSLGATSTISGDVLVPGTPTVSVTGSASLVGTRNGPGAATPTGYSVALSGNAVARYVVEQINPIALPTVTAGPTSTSNLSLTSASGTVPLAAGNYGAVLVNGANLVLGTSGATAASVYNFGSISVGGGGQISVVGPVVLVVNGKAVINGNIGNSAVPAWLVLGIPSGTFTLSTNSLVSGTVVAPNGTVIINAGCEILGTVTAATLDIASGGVLQQPTLPAP